MNSIKKNTEALLIPSKEIGIDVTTEKIKYMFMSWNRNAGQNHNLKASNIPFESTEQFKYYLWEKP
jgi:hypothetical protein